MKYKLTPFNFLVCCLLIMDVVFFFSPKDPYALRELGMFVSIPIILVLLYVDIILQNLNPSPKKIWIIQGIVIMILLLLFFLF